MVCIVARASRVQGPDGEDLGGEDFPNFDRYLQEFARVMSEPKIWNAFKKWSGLSDSLAQMSVTYGGAPVIDFLPQTTRHHGEFQPASSHRIWIRVDKVRDYENSQDYSNGKYLQLLILREMVDWGRHLAHLHDDDRSGGVDNRDRFEDEAYSHRSN
jgi:hypothetical protein